MSISIGYIFSIFVFIAITGDVFAITSQYTTCTSCTKLEQSVIQLTNNFYDEAIGQFQDIPFWQTGLALESIANVMMISNNTTLVDNLALLVENTYKKNSDMTVYSPSHPGPVDRMLSGYFDDELWWFFIFDTRIFFLYIFILFSCNSI